MTNKQRQHLLAYLGYYEMNVDGYWGSGSREACKAFQRDLNLTVDGYGGPETDKQLRYAVYNDLEKTEPEEDATDNNVGDKTGTFWDHIRYWKREEFRCRCGGKYCNGFPAEPDQTLVELVDDIRHKAGRPGIPSSGLRCKTWNSIQGGVANSDHMKGKALDFSIEGMSGAQLLSLALADPRTRYAYIIDGGWVHVDVE
ncbi:MAG: peptidoglycan-binding protein [Oscillospiraceae bacterium]|nr:peptidoglycan-binding protein [Oscillospiraceae bacterium]